jgi:hypothetical protein
MPSSAVARRKGKAAPAATFRSPVARDYPSRVLDNPLRPSHLGCSIKEHAQYITIAPSIGADLGNCTAEFVRPEKPAVGIGILSSVRIDHLCDDFGRGHRGRSGRARGHRGKAILCGLGLDLGTTFSRNVVFLRRSCSPRPTADFADHADGGRRSDCPR